MDKAVIISVPLLRNLRTHASKVMIHSLMQDYQIIVVAPFQIAEDFSLFKENNIKFFLFNESYHFKNYREPSLKNNLVSNLLLLSEVLRVQGFIFKNRGNLKFKYHNLTKKFIVNSEKDMGILVRIIAFFGSSPLLYRILNNLIAILWSKNFCVDLQEYVKQFKSVNLIQCANWGLQDRVIGTLAIRNKWNSYFIPYTTDQIWKNGYLIQKFNKVLLQGPAEYKYARMNHKLKSKELDKIGSLWFRVIDSYKVCCKLNNGYIGEKRRILFTGTSSTFFPMESQIEAIIILDQILNKILDKYEIVFRPIFSSEKEEQESVSFIKGKSEKIHFWMPERECYGLESIDYVVKDNYLNEVENYLEELSNFSFVVSSGGTSLSLEAAYIGVPSIAIYFDHTGTLKNRRIDLFLEEGFYIPKELVATNQGSLELIVNRMICDESFRKESAYQIFNDWDYSSCDFQEILIGNLNK